MSFDAVIERMQAYKRVFKGEKGKVVMADLEAFCFGNRPTADINNVYATYVAEGRREVLLRIQDHLNRKESDIQKLSEEYTNE